MFLGASLKVLVALAVVVGAMAAYRYQIKTSPRLGRKKPPRQARLVQVINVHSSDCTTTVTGDGVVMPAQQVTLRPQVAGKVVRLSPDVVPGGIVAEGQDLLAIDRRDYDVLVRQRQYDVARAERDLKVEQGNRAIAEMLISRGLDQTTIVITHELTSDRRTLLMQGVIDAILDQNPEHEAFTAVETLAHHFGRIEAPPNRLVTPFTLFLRDNA